MGDDDDIRAALRSGDVETAFRLLDGRYKDLLFDRCYSVLRDHALAEDAVQRTMIRALEKVDSLDEVRNLRGWLLTVVGNLALDMWRSVKRHSGRIERVRQAGTVEDVQAMPVVNADAEHEHAALERCLDELEPDTRLAFLRRFQDGAPWEDIARELDIAADAARMRVRRARKLLKRCLERQEVER